jgi:hypothetical protein
MQTEDMRTQKVFDTVVEKEAVVVVVARVVTKEESVPKEAVMACGFESYSRGYS